MSMKKLIIATIKKILGSKYDYYKIKAKSKVYSLKTEAKGLFEAKPSAPIMQPLVSIIMTVYNRETYIKQAIDWICQ